MIIFKALLFSIVWAAISCVAAQAADHESSSVPTIREEILRKAKSSMREGDFSSARSQLDYLLRRSPEESNKLAPFYAECYRRWGMQLLENGNTSVAFEKFEKCLYYDPEDVKTRDRFHKMIEELKLDPQSADTRLDLAKQARLRGDVEAAIVELEAAYKINPDYKTLMQLGSLLELRDQYERAKDAGQPGKGQDKNKVLLLTPHQFDATTDARLRQLAFLIRPILGYLVDATENELWVELGGYCDLNPDLGSINSFTFGRSKPPNQPVIRALMILTFNSFKSEKPSSISFRCQWKCTVRKNSCEFSFQPWNSGPNSPDSTNWPMEHLYLI